MEAIAHTIQSFFVILFADLVTVYSFIASHPSVIAIGCGVIMLLALAAGAFGRANRVIESTKKKEDK